MRLRLHNVIRYAKSPAKIHALKALGYVEEPEPASAPPAREKKDAQNAKTKTAKSG
jgi:hypothetical protein